MDDKSLEISNSMTDDHSDFCTFVYCSLNTLIQSSKIARLCMGMDVK